MDPHRNQHQLFTFLRGRKKAEKNRFFFPFRLHRSGLLVGDPWESRTPVCGVRGRRLDHLTNGPRRKFQSAPSKPNNVDFQFSASACILMLRSSPRLISTGQLHALQRFHLRPINDVVYIEPYLIKSERSHLRGSFTLRCLQRLSRPNVATQLCPWQDNWCTRGSSIPVLSY